MGPKIMYEAGTEVESEVNVKVGSERGSREKWLNKNIKSLGE